MYSNEEKHINWLDLLIKIIFGALFILILVWLFPKVPNMKPFYSNVFRENIKYMQEAGESYFTNDRLPKEEGKSVKLTLKELMNKSLVLPFVDKDGASCNVYSSYVEVTKGDNEYILKTSLVCNNEQNYVNKVLGCYDYCEDCKNEEVVKTGTQYQFKKQVDSSYNKYSCPEGYSLEGAFCYRTTSTTKDTIKTYKKVVDYSENANLGYYDGSKQYLKDTPSQLYQKEECPNGYTRSNDNKCYKKVTTNAVSGSTSYQCNEGTLSGSSCRLTAAKIKGIPYKQNICSSTPGCFNYITIYPYSCPANYYKENGTCARYVPATAVVTGSVCPSGYNKDTNGTCYKYDYANMVYTYGVKYYCPANYFEEGINTSLRCYTYTSGGYYYYCNKSDGVINGSKCDYFKTITEYKCDADYNLNNGVCVKSYTDKINAYVEKVQGFKYSYTWSTKETLNGWTYTGNKRTVNM
ncbi:MAG: hypothetical protein RR228_01205 [Bacilli bacterium]